tara:strand:- start:4408 stop:4722 length:315 start_codon:yes stop_codon:yes gene_type:complete
MKDSFPSICIPYTINDISKNMINSIFIKLLSVNCIDRIDIITKYNNQNNLYKTIFIHLTEWPQTDEAQKMRHKLILGSHINIVYNLSLFLPCYASRSIKPTFIR